MAFVVKKPTIRPANPFNASEDANVLRAAMKALGTNEKKIIGVLTKRSAYQRLEIGTVYGNQFGRDLIADLKSELGGKFETLIMALMQDPYEYLAQELHRAMDRLGTKEDVLTEILCSHENAEIQKISDAYLKLYEKALSADIKGEISGDYEKLLLMLLSNVRDENRYLDQTKAKNYAGKLYKCGEGRLGTDEETFITTLTHQSFPQLKLIFMEYDQLAGKTFEQAVESELSGDFKEAILAIVRCAISTPLFFAEKLHDAMDRLGTSDKALIRIIVSRAEIDLGDIKAEYQNKYHETLESAIKKETSGDYESALVSILEGN